MKTVDLFQTAIRNTFRSKLRTSLTVIAIFIGAFTLTITSAIGTGVSSYIDAQISSLGTSSSLTVTKASSATSNDGPREYDADSSNQTSGVGPQTTTNLSDADIDTIRDTPGVESVKENVTINVTWVEYDNNGKYVVAVGENTGTSEGSLDLAAGEQLTDDSDKNQVVLPSNTLKNLGLETPTNAIGKTISIAVKDYVGAQHEIDATVVGVQNESLLGGGAVANSTLSSALQAAQDTSRPESAETSYVSATVLTTSDENRDLVKSQLQSAGYTGQTTADQLGQFQTIINGIVGILDAFAVIALLAAGFGIVNTLLMSVQERTREIGLMKAMGMGGGKVFTLFSIEAIFIGLLGSAIGALAAIILGSVLSDTLASTVLSDLPGLHLLQFAPLSVVAIVFSVMSIAFLAGTLPARRASRQNPIEALRYE